MKKAILILLSLVMVLSLCACGGTTAPEPTPEPTPEVTPESTPEPTLTKEEMLEVAIPMTRDDISKSIDNIAFAKSLIGNVYTFDGFIFSVEEDYAIITFYIVDDNGAYATAANVMVGNLYLPLEELVSLEAEQRFSFVGKLDDVSTHEYSIPDWGTTKVVDMVFQSCAIIDDRFEATGKVHSKNAGYGADAWNILPPDSNYAYVVHFRDDISSYKGKTITFSYKKTSEGNVDAYIVK